MDVILSRFPQLRLTGATLNQSNTTVRGKAIHYVNVTIISRQSGGRLTRLSQVVYQCGAQAGSNQGQEQFACSSRDIGYPDGRHACRGSFIDFSSPLRLAASQGA